MVDEYLKEFVHESDEQITTLNNALLDLENDPTDEAAMEEIFRTAHTLKSNCGAMGFTRASSLAHAIEDLLEEVRTGRVEPAPELMDAVFEGVDELQAMLSEVETHGEPQRSADEIVERLRSHVPSAAELAPPSDAKIDSMLDAASPDRNGYNLYHGRLSIAGDETTNGPALIDALEDAFELYRTTPSRKEVAEAPYGATIDALFGSVVDESAVLDALAPVEAVDQAIVTEVTDRHEPSDSGDSASASTDAPTLEDPDDVDVDDLLSSVDHFDDIDEMAEQVEDTSGFENLGDAGSFDDLEVEVDDELGIDEPADAGSDTEDTAQPADSEASDSEPEDANETFQELKQEVDPVSFDELQDELEDLEFDEYADEEEVGFDELLDEDELDDDEPFDPGATDDDPFGSAADDEDVDELLEETLADSPDGVDTSEEPVFGDDAEGPAGGEDAFVTGDDDGIFDDIAAEVSEDSFDGDVPEDDQAVDADEIVDDDLTVDEPASDEPETDELDVAELKDAAVDADDPEGTEAEDVVADVDSPEDTEAEDTVADVDDPEDTEPVLDEEEATEAVDTSATGSDADVEDALGDGTADTPAEPDAATTDQDETVPVGNAPELDDDSSFGDVTDPVEPTAAEDSFDDVQFGDETESIEDAALGQPADDTFTEADDEEKTVEVGTGIEDDSFGPDVEEGETGGADTGEGAESELETAADDSIDEFGADTMPETGTTPDTGTADEEFASVETGTVADDESFESSGADEGSFSAPADPGFGKPEETDESDQADRDIGLADLGVPSSVLSEAQGPEGEVQSIRVDVDRMDEMLNLIEGLVTSRARLRRSLDAGDPRSVLDDELGDLEEVTSELQDTVMDVRLVPLNTIVSKLPRTVRDIARDRDKQVDLEMTGTDVEIDRSILNDINDPLVHLVRNAVDHGIEAPTEREEVGKDPTGTVTLSAERRRDSVVIEVVDDGRGLDPEELIAEAVEEGVITEDEADELSESEAYELVFHSGLSTSDEVTDVSGRGVGMDVVASTVDDLDGELHIDSELGEGTTVRLELPVTLAIAEVLFVEVGDEEYGVPIKFVEQIGPEIGVETQDGQEVLVSDGGETDDSSTARELIRLDEVLDTPGQSDPNGMVIHIRDDVRQIALRCDSVRNQQEVVIKPFEGVLESVPGLSGATVLGDGDVVNILDVETI